MFVSLSLSLICVCIKSEMERWRGWYIVWPLGITAHACGHAHAKAKQISSRGGCPRGHALDHAWEQMQSKERSRKQEGHGPGRAAARDLPSPFAV